MAVLTIGGQDYPAAFNLRALRLFKKETGQSLPAALASLKGPDVELDKDGNPIVELDEKGNPKEPQVLEVDFGTLAYIIWALANAKPKGPEFEFVESNIDVDNIKGIMEQLGAIRSTEEPSTPLAAATEETNQ